MMWNGFLEKFKYREINQIIEQLEQIIDKQEYHNTYLENMINNVMELKFILDVFQGADLFLNQDILNIIEFLLAAHFLTILKECRNVICEQHFSFTSQQGLDLLGKIVHPLLGYFTKFVSENNRD